MEYLIALFKGMAGVHWGIALLLTVVVIQFGFIRFLAKQNAENHKIITMAHKRAAEIADKYASSVDKASDNALNFSKALTDLLVVFKDLKK